jgi:hypothetical protein
MRKVGRGLLSIAAALAKAECIRPMATDWTDMNGWWLPETPEQVARFKKACADLPATPDELAAALNHWSEGARKLRRVIAEGVEQ